MSSEDISNKFAHGSTSKYQKHSGAHPQFSQPGSCRSRECRHTCCVGHTDAACTLAHRRVKPAAATNKIIYFRSAMEKPFKWNTTYANYNVSTKWRDQRSEHIASLRNLRSDRSETRTAFRLSWPRMRMLILSFERQATLEWIFALQTQCREWVKTVCCYTSLLRIRKGSFTHCGEN